VNHYHPTVAESSHETEVKRSRFITYIAHTPDIPASQAFIEKITPGTPKLTITAGRE
jgi:putative IMPACT (imprinted ancient) family translation regulator